MTDDQILKAKLLAHCTFLPGSKDKRFVSFAYTLARDEMAIDLTERQADYLEQLFHKYRRQILGHEQICSVCGEKKVVAGTKQSGQ